MTKSWGSPAWPASRRRMRTQRLWKVEIQLCSRCPASSVSVRAFISPAALLVKVTARICSEGTPRSSTRWAMRCVITRVLPLPAPARISTGPSVASTASRCCSFSPSTSFDSLNGKTTETRRHGERRRQRRPHHGRLQKSATQAVLRASASPWLPSWPLLDRDGLREVPRLVHVAARADGHVIGQELEGEDRDEGRPHL